ncbi:Hypothetical_protein [Hexamita inflata]|nr:Hypothetical protein HINF_LOCUS25349 [Hexamita inflata]
MLRQMSHFGSNCLNTPQFTQPRTPRSAIQLCSLLFIRCVDRHSEWCPTRKFAMSLAHSHVIRFSFIFKSFTFTALCLQLLTHGGQPARLLYDSISRARRRCLQTSKRRCLIFWFCCRSLAIAVVSELEEATEPALARRHSTPRPTARLPAVNLGRRNQFRA